MSVFKTLGMDPSKFKHVHSTDKSTTLRHKDGHSITVAHAPLSPKMQNQLKALSKIGAENQTNTQAQEAQDQGKRRMAKGGKVPHYDEGTPDSPVSADDGEVMSHMDGKKHQSPINININSGPQPNQSQTPQASTPPAQEQGTQAQAPADQGPQQPNQGQDLVNQASQQAMQPQAVTAQQNAEPAVPMRDNPEPPTPDQQAVQEVQQDPNSPPAIKATPPPIQKTFEDHKQVALQDMSKEDQEFQKDLKDGHITPKTYQSLFDNQRTMGKIGTIFGMLLSGAGSGLAHQQNLMFKMMDDQITNDLNSQMKSKENAQNFYRLTMEHEKNKNQEANISQDTQMKAYSLAKMRMNNAALHQLVGEVAKMPPGSPQRMQAEQQLAMINQGVQNDNFNLMDRAAAGSAFYKTMFGGQQPGQDQENAFKQQNNSLRMLGEPGTKRAEYNEQHHVPGYSEMASHPVSEEDRAQINAHNVLDQKGKDILKYIKQNSGTLNPQKRAVVQQKVEEMKNFYNDSIKGGALTEGRLGWYDEQFKKNPTDIVPQLLGNTKKLEEMVNSNSQRKDELVKKLGINPRSAAVQPVERIDKSNGKTALFDPNTKKFLGYK